MSASGVNVRSAGGMSTDIYAKWAAQLVDHRAASRRRWRSRRSLAPVRERPGRWRAAVRPAPGPSQSRVPPAGSSRLARPRTSPRAVRGWQSRSAAGRGSTAARRHGWRTRRHGRRPRRARACPRRRRTPRARSTGAEVQGPLGRRHGCRPAPKPATMRPGASSASDANAAAEATGWRLWGLVTAPNSSTRRVRWASAARVTYRSRSVPSSATRTAAAPNDSAAAASSASSATGRTACSQTPQCVSGKDTLADLAGQ